MTINLERCSICLENFENNKEKKIAHIPEKIGVELHVFHDICLNRWALINPECPLCKRSIAPGIRSFKIMSVAVRAGLFPQQLEVIRFAQENKFLFLSYFLLSNNIDQQTRGLAVRCAAKEGNFFIILLLIKTGEINSVDLGLSIKSSSGIGNSLIVSFLLSKGSISEDHRGLALRKASKNNHFSIVKMLLQSGSISDNDYYLALLDSCNNDDPAIFRFLLNRPINVNYRGNLFLFLLRRGDFLLAQEVLENGDIDKQSINEGIIISSRNGHFIILNYLLEKEGIEDIVINRALQIVFKNDQIRTSLILILYRYHGSERDAFPEILMFIQDKKITPSQLGRSICCLAEKGCFQTVELMLKQGDITQYYRGLALLMAAKNNNFLIVELLIKNGPINQKDILASIVESSKIGSYEIISFLLPFSCKSVEIDYAVWNASSKGYLDIVNLLLDLTTSEGMFLEWSIEDALIDKHFVVAIYIVCHIFKNNKNVDFLIRSIKWFINENTIDKLELKKAIFCAIKVGCKDLIVILKQNCQLSDVEKKMFVLYALEFNKNDLVKVLN